MAEFISFSPFPLTKTTIFSSSLILPSPIAFFRAAKGTTPEGSPKTLVSLANSGIARTICSSLTDIAKPLDPLIAFRAASPSWGKLTEILSAIVSPLTGRITPSDLKARLIASIFSDWQETSWGNRSMNPISKRSTNPFHTPLMRFPSPTEINTLSGHSQLNCSQISNAHVFFPSRVYGLYPELRLYQPYFSVALMHRSNASSYVPLTAITMAPNTNSWAIFATGEVSGIKMIVFNPSAAVRHESDEAAFPVEAQVMIFSPLSRALATAMAPGLSLREALGFRPSSLI